jgi:hypothetical protein
VDGIRLLKSANTDETPALVTILLFGEISEALLAKGCLDSAGIECFLADTNVARLEWPITRGMRLQVNADDAEAALAVLTQGAATDSDF